mgnify:CR=1 FL=1
MNHESRGRRDKALYSVGSRMNVPSLLKEHNSGRFTEIKLSWEADAMTEKENRGKQRQLGIGARGAIDTQMAPDF